MRAMVVLIGGKLRGMEREINCEVVARRAPFDPDAGYVDAFILNAPPDLPNGEYTVILDHHTILAANEHGLWFSLSDPSRAFNDTADTAPFKRP
jgi:hypothetical protein